MLDRFPLPPPNPLASASALSSIAVAFHAPAQLVRGGAYGRAERLADEHGWFIDDAADAAANQGKGHIGELIQAASFTTQAGALQRSTSAHINRRANDPRDDVVVWRNRRKVMSAQIKVGSNAYIKKAAKTKKYKNLVVNRDALQAIGAVPERVRDRLAHGGLEAQPLDHDECHAQASTTLERLLADEPVVQRLEVLAACLKAGLTDGLTSIALYVAGAFAESKITGSRFDLLATVREALRAGARAVLRTSMRSYILVSSFVQRARTSFSAKLIQRLMSSASTVGVFVEAVIEVGADLIDMLRGRLSLEQVLRRSGVHTLSAAGGAIGAAAGAAITSGCPWWLSVLAMLGLGYLGTKVGHELGCTLFLPVAVVTTAS